MPMTLERLRNALSRQPRPLRLRWNERHRHRFLNEYHEMKARSPAELYRLDEDLVWFGHVRDAIDQPVEVAIRYQREHPSRPPQVFVLSPSSVAEALPRAADGSIQVLSPGAYHAGLTVFDFWCWIRRLVMDLRVKAT